MVEISESAISSEIYLVRNASNTKASENTSVYRHVTYVSMYRCMDTHGDDTVCTPSAWCLRGQLRPQTQSDTVASKHGICCPANQGATGASSDSENIRR